jgi:hypothetical protein
MPAGHTGILTRPNIPVVPVLCMSICGQLVGLLIIDGLSNNFDLKGKLK